MLAAAEGTKSPCAVAGAVAGPDPHPGAIRVLGVGGGGHPCPLATPRRPPQPHASPLPPPGGCSEGVTGGVTPRVLLAGSRRGGRGRGGRGWRGPEAGTAGRRWPSAGGGLPLEVPGQHCPAEGHRQPHA